MTTDSRLRQLQAQRQLGGGGRAVVEDGTGDPVPRAVLLVLGSDRRSGRGGGRGSVWSDNWVGDRADDWGHRRTVGGLCGRRSRVMPFSRFFHNVIVA
jgi:hypothetical protein